MLRNWKFWLLALWAIASRLYDILCTYEFTPDLTKEVNPLASVLGLSWLPILLVIGSLLFYSIYAAWDYRRQPTMLYPTSPGFSFIEFMTFVYLGKKDHWWALFIKFPTNLKRLHVFIGSQFLEYISWAGVISTAMWIGLKYIPAYRPLHNVIAIYSIIIAGCAAWYIYWFRQHYLHYKASQQNPWIPYLRGFQPCATNSCTLPLFATNNLPFSGAVMWPMIEISGWFFNFSNADMSTVNNNS